VVCVDKHNLLKIWPTRRLITPFTKTKKEKKTNCQTRQVKLNTNQIFYLYDIRAETLICRHHVF